MVNSKDKTNIPQYLSYCDQGYMYFSDIFIRNKVKVECIVKFSKCYSFHWPFLKCVQYNKGYHSLLSICSFKNYCFCMVLWNGKEI